MRAAWISSTILDKKSEGCPDSATRDWPPHRIANSVDILSSTFFPNSSFHSTTWYIPSSIYARQRVCHQTSTTMVKLLSIEAVSQTSICIVTFVLSSLSLVLTFSTSCSLCCWMFRSLIVRAKQCDQISAFPIVLEFQFRWTNHMPSWILSPSLLGSSLKICKCSSLPAQALLFTAHPHSPCGKISKCFGDSESHLRQDQNRAFACKSWDWQNCWLCG